MRSKTFIRITAAVLSASILAGGIDLPVLSHYLNLGAVKVSADEAGYSDWATLKYDIEHSMGENTFVLSQNIYVGAQDEIINIHSGNEVTLDLNGNSIEVSGYEGSLFHIDAGSLTIPSAPVDGTIRGARSSDDGGAFYVENNGSLTLSGSNVVDNKSEGNGGAVYCKGGTVTLSGGTVRDNMAEYYGGGIYMESGTLVLKSGYVMDNYSSADGHGIYITSDANVKISGTGQSINISNNFEKGNTSNIGNLYLPSGKK